MTPTLFVRALGRSLILLMVICFGAAAQDLGTVDPKPLPPLAHPDDPKTPAKELFGRVTTPAKTAARSIGAVFSSATWRSRAAAR